MSKEKYDLFVSYSRTDIKEVLQLVNLLKSRIPGLACWFDITGIESASEFEEKIISAINNSEYVLFAVSDNSLKSDWSKDEVTYAKNIGKKVIPVLLKGTSMQEGWFLFKFGRVDCIDSTDDMQVEKLISDLSRWVDKPAESEVEPTYVPLWTRIRNFIEPRKKLVLSVLASALLMLVLALSFGLRHGESVEPETQKNLADSVELAVESYDVVAHSSVTPEPVAPAQNAPVQTAPVRKAPVQSTPAKNTPAQNTPVVNEPEKKVAEPVHTGATVNGYKYVDLGLSVKWASHNIGANAPSAYGDYFAWGEIRPKREYTDSNSLTFNHAIGDIAGDPAHDAARALWGSPWRLPSRNEIKELVMKCSWTIVTNQGHNCFKVVGPNGNYIYLPIAGHYISSSLEKLGEAGHYMTSNAPTGNRNRMYGLCLKADSKQYFMHIWSRSVGQSIRPVFE